MPKGTGLQGGDVVKIAGIVIIDEDGDAVFIEENIVMQILLDTLNGCPFDCE